MPGQIPAPDTPFDRRPTVVSDSSTLKPPAWLGPDAKKIFKKTASELKALGLSAKADTDTLAIYSMQFARLQQIYALPTKDRWANKSLNELSTQCLSLIRELGLGPASRAKLRIAKIEEADELDEL